MGVLDNTGEGRFMVLRGIDLGTILRVKGFGVGPLVRSVFVGITLGFGLCTIGRLIRTIGASI